MNTEIMRRHFEKMGARLRIERGIERPRFGGSALSPGPVVIDVLRDQDGEYFQINVEPGAVELHVEDVRAKDRHLLLLARLTREDRKDKFLCGHDERAWFVAAVPSKRGVSSVSTAMEALKPPVVRRVQDAIQLRQRDRNRRRNEAFIRQGEWFFIPVPGFEPRGAVHRNEPLQRGAGNPHMCAYLCRAGGETVYVHDRAPNGLTEAERMKLFRRNPDARNLQWRLMTRGARVYAKGAVRHADHATISLPCWHLVVLNTETDAPAMRHVAFLD